MINFILLRNDEDEIYIYTSQGWKWMYLHVNES
jgi:hypothetical protein